MTLNFNKNNKIDIYNTKNRYFYLDIFRIIAVFLVVYAHFISVGMHAVEIPYIISGNIKLPLLQPNYLENFDNFLIHTFRTQAGILGVSFFFVTTGYLMPMMLEKYSRIEFLINRFFRIFPNLIFSVLFIGMFIKITQGIDFSFLNYLGSITLLYPIMKVSPITGVLWTLVIEMIFYFICSIIGKFNVIKFLVLQMLIFLIIFFIIVGNHKSFSLLVTDLRFIAIILMGTSFFIAERFNKILCKIIIIIESLLFSFTSFYLTKYFLQDNSTFNNFNTHLITILSLLILYFLIKNIDYTKCKILNLLSFLAKLVYPIYLLHTSIGLVLILLLRNFIPNHTNIILFTAIIVIIVLSILCYRYIEQPGIKIGKNIIKKMRLKNE